MRRTVISLGALLALGCAASTPGAPPPAVEVRVDRMMPMSESLEAAAVEVTLRLYNPHAEAITVDGFDYSVDTRDVGGMLRGHQDSRVSLKPAEAAQVKFVQRIPFPEGERYLGIIERSTIPIELAGKITQDNGATVDFKRFSEVATPALPELVVFDAQAARYGDEGVDLTLFLRLVNDNVFPVSVRGVRYTVYINDQEFKSEEAALGIRLMASAAEEYEVGAILDAESFKNPELANIMRDKRLVYTVKGEVELPKLTRSFEHRGVIELATGE